MRICYYPIHVFQDWHTKAMQILAVRDKMMLQMIAEAHSSVERGG